LIQKANAITNILIARPITIESANNKACGFVGLRILVFFKNYFIIKFSNSYDDLDYSNIRLKLPLQIRMPLGIRFESL